MGSKNLLFGSCLNKENPHNIQPPAYLELYFSVPANQCRDEDLL